jgi:hypothetical protein
MRPASFRAKATERLLPTRPKGMHGGNLDSEVFEKERCQGGKKQFQAPLQVNRNKMFYKKKDRQIFKPLNGDPRLRDRCAKERIR